MRVAFLLPAVVFGSGKSQAARLLGLTRNALRYRLAQMGLEKEAPGAE